MIQIAPLTEYWTELNYHEMQNRAWNSQKQFVNIVAGRRSGKTELARRKTVLELAIKKPWPNPISVYCLPTFAQAKKVAWTPLLNLIPDNWIKKNGINLSDMRIETIFGSTLYVMGMDKPERIEGLPLDSAVLDESSDQKPGAFSVSILPALAERSGWCWRIGVPKRSGVGRIEFKEWFDKGYDQENPRIDSFTWFSDTVVDADQIEMARQNLTEEDFNEQFRATWLEGGGSIYHAYSHDNIDDEVQYHDDEIIYVGCDFNVNPMCWVLGHMVGNDRATCELEVFDEIFLKNTNTEATLNHLFTRYGQHKAGWAFHGDASSRQRKTSASKTDYIIIKNDRRFEDNGIYFPRQNPAILDRFATVNAALRNASGVNRVRIHPRCERLIKDLKVMAYKEGTTEPEDYTGTEIGHMADGFGYLVMRVIPMKIFDDSVPEVLSTRGY